MCNYAGAKLVGAPMFRDDQGKWQYDFEKFEQCINEKTKAVIITNPHNPTGKVFTREELEKLSAILDKYPQVIVISDDVYYFLPFDGMKYEVFADIGNNYQRTLTVYSAGKMMNCTGWRTGWVIGPKELVKYATLVHENSVFNVFVPG
jgi:aspartate/methionine/tyrosine aminotransferase